MKRILFISIIISIICSCGKDADDIDNNFGEEVINGFVVKWDQQTTKEQRDAITEILNDMVFVKGGTFIMGATDEQVATGEPRNNEYPTHLVQLSDYYICKHELTTEMINKLFGSYYLPTSRSSWAFYNEVIIQLRQYTKVDFDFPTEAQWEYAARGGQLSKGFVYPGSNTLSDVWVGSKKSIGQPIAMSDVPNELGIFNFADGYAEWCKDYYSEYSDKETILYNPVVFSGEYHVIRGGIFYQKKDYKHSDSWYKSIDYPLQDLSVCRTTFRSSARSYSTSIGDNPDGNTYTTIRPVINAISR